MRYKVLVTGLLLTLCGCSEHNNLVAGRVENTVAGHKVVVTDCYQTSVSEPGPDSWMPCKDADIKIGNGQLTVNGQGYGQISPGDSVLVDHGKVSIDRAAARK